LLLAALCSDEGQWSGRDLGLTTLMKKDSSIKQQLLDEIQGTCAAKLFNLQHGTINPREQAVFDEARAFLDLINYSCLPLTEIKRLWDDSNLKFQ
jgi:hypothetical protein